MEKSRRAKNSNRGIEENTLAILESFCSFDSSHVHDDRLAFLEAVRFASIVATNGTRPTNKMMEAIFEIMREAKSLELIVASYQLLCEIQKHFPRVCLAYNDDKRAAVQLDVLDEAWSPFAVGSDVVSNERNSTKKSSKEPIDAHGFLLLLQSLSEVVNEADSSDMKLELLEKMFLFQYLVCILEGDFFPRNHDFLENSNWISLRDSLLNKILGSRRVNYKDFVKECLFLLCNMFLAHTPTNHDTESAKSSSTVICSNDMSALALSLPEVEKCTVKAVQSLLKMMMDLDDSRKKAGLQGLTTRGDGVRTPAVELIMDELSYDKDMISPFLQAFNEPKLKLEIISQYIQKYNVKPSTRKRKSIDLEDDAGITGFFKCFLNITSTKGIVKKVGDEAVQVLLAHTLQACMSISREQLEEILDFKDDTRSSPLMNICESIHSAFAKLRETDENFQILPMAKEALFTAAAILSTRS